MSSPSPAPSNDSKETEEKYQSSPEPEQDQKQKGKETAVDNDAPTSETTAAAASLSAGSWQAVFSPQYNAYYFYNTATCETTWINPIQSPPSDPSSSSTGADGTGADVEAAGLDGTVNPNPYDPNSLEARAIAAGIDPSLAHLDPSLAGLSSLAHTGTFTAKFNARTGAFTAPEGRVPSHLSEYERMKRMNAFYFDVGAWEKEVEQRDAEEKEVGGKKRKRPSKKDLERFKEQKRLKKIAKTAWLRT